MKKIRANKKFGKATVDIRPIYKNQLCFYTLAKNNPKRKLAKTIPFIIVSKIK